MGRPHRDGTSPAWPSVALGRVALVRAALVRVALVWMMPLAAMAGPPLPRPESLEPAVSFWAMIYRDLDTGAGLIHDTEELDVIYDTLHFPPDSSWRDQQRQLREALEGTRAALRRAAAGATDGAAARAAAAWGEGAQPAGLRAAAQRVRFQRGQADRFRAGLVRSRAWRGYIEAALAEAQVPPALVALPHVESAFDPAARSHAGAAGLWQFTEPTGRQYLRIDHVIDERFEPRAATRAAAALLRYNYQRTGSWPLAITAYNHGLAGVLRARDETRTDDIGVILARYQGPRFGFASRNFYPAFLAASELDRQADMEFAVPPPAGPLEHVVTVTDFVPVSALTTALGVDAELLRRHNPALQATVWSGSKRVPPKFPLRLPAALTMVDAELAMARLPPQSRYRGQLPDRYHDVRPGESLSVIARRYGSSVRELSRINALPDPHRIRAGTRLVLPGAVPTEGAE